MIGKDKILFNEATEICSSLITEVISLNGLVNKLIYIKKVEILPIVSLLNLQNIIPNIAIKIYKKLEINLIVGFAKEEKNIVL